MKDKSSTFGVSPKKVIKLLKIGKDADSTPIDIGQYKSDLISERLNETVPIYFSTERNPTKQLKRLRHTIAVLSGESIGKLLESPETDIRLIRMVKDYARKLSSRAESEAEHHISNTIYYAAIAHALIYHDIKITNYSYENLKKSYDRLSEENWIPNNLIVIFKKVSEYCQTKAKGYEK